MTAISAAPASERATSAELASGITPIRLPGSQRTFEAREVLREMGLRWDPATHAWHGLLGAARRTLLERSYGLVPQVVVPIEAFQAPGKDAGPTSPAPRPSVGARGPARDYSRSRLEARVALPGGEEDAEPVGARFSLQDITSGLPDDSREADDRAASHRLRDLRSRVKAARAAIGAVPGAQEVLRQDWVRAAYFYARFGITESQFRHGVPTGTVPNAIRQGGETVQQVAGVPSDRLPWDSRLGSHSHWVATSLCCQ